MFIEEFRREMFIQKRFDKIRNTKHLVYLQYILIRNIFVCFLIKIRLQNDTYLSK